MNLLKKFSGASSLLMILAAPALASVTVSVPVNGAAVSSPFVLYANASACSSQTISAMGYSLDNSSNTTIVYSNTVLAAITSTAGAHTLHVKSWGNQGAACSTSVAINVTVTTTSPSGLSVSSPTNGATVTSPFSLSAAASACSSQAVGAMGYSLDNSTNTTIVPNTSLSAQVAAAAGAHTLHIEAWGYQGASCYANIPITVVTSAAPVVPPNAIGVSGIQTLSNWEEVNDTAGNGSSTGSMSIVGSPSLSGQARQFVTSYSNAGDELYYATFGTDTTSNNFLYDGWVYIASPSGDIANLEMDLNQVMANGQTVIFGFQCDGYSGTWDYTANEGTPQNPSDKWLHSNAACNVSNWSTNTWHHVQIGYSRDNYGNVTYQAVWLDGVEQQLNVTVPSAFALGWAPVLLTNFEVDGLGSSGSSTVYLDNLTVYRWVE
jgi:hypothetical protein